MSVDNLLPMSEVAQDKRQSERERGSRGEEAQGSWGAGEQGRKGEEAQGRGGLGKTERCIDEELSFERSTLNLDRFPND
jgi:hypothetical protein